jgi:predicted nuclease with TOPRIM domain
MNENEINNLLENDLNEIDTKLDEIDTKLDELDSKIEELENNDVMDTDYFENYDEEDTSDDMFGSGFDDFGGFDDV